MNTTALATPAPARVFRRSVRDSWLVGLAGAHLAALVLIPSIPTVALALWWNSNSVSHNFIHNPFFRARGLNVLFSALLSLLLGFPQTLWRERHLAHHAGRAPRLRASRALVAETLLVCLLWATLLACIPVFFLTVYLPGYVLGMFLCFLQGHYEHRSPDGRAVDHHGALYNWIFFNDGYHGAHHAQPGRHWSQLPDARSHGARRSRWPAVLRWLEASPLDGLERLVLWCAPLGAWVVDRHQRAVARLLPQLERPRRVAIVGGGLFPRTAIVLRRLLGESVELTIIDRDPRHLEIARRVLDGGRYGSATPGAPVVYRNEEFDAPACGDEFDLVVIPLAYAGDRAALYRAPPAPALLIHDWLWKRRGVGVRVSFVLLKRLNLVRREPA